MAKRIQSSQSRSALFLIEMIIAIGFFAVASAVCIQLFAHARLVGVQSDELTRATLTVQSVAESFKAADGDLYEMQVVLGGEASSEELLTLALGPDFSIRVDDKALSSNPSYLMTVQKNTQGQVVSADIAVTPYDSKRVIYQLAVKTLAGG